MSSGKFLAQLFIYVWLTSVLQGHSRNYITRRILKSNTNTYVTLRPEKHTKNNFQQSFQKELAAIVEASLDNKNDNQPQADTKPLGVKPFAGFHRHRDRSCRTTGTVRYRPSRSCLEVWKLLPSFPKNLLECRFPIEIFRECAPNESYNPSGPRLHYDCDCTRILTFSLWHLSWIAMLSTYLYCADDFILT